MARAGSSSGDAAAGERRGAGRLSRGSVPGGGAEGVRAAHQRGAGVGRVLPVPPRGCGARRAGGAIRDTADILLRRDGSVSARRSPAPLVRPGRGRCGAGAAPAAGRDCDPPSSLCPTWRRTRRPPCRAFSAGPADLSHFRAPSAALGALLWLLSLLDWKAPPSPLPFCWEPPTLRWSSDLCPRLPTHTRTPGTHLTTGPVLAGEERSWPWPRTFLRETRLCLLPALPTRSASALGSRVSTQ